MASYFNSVRQSSFNAFGLGGINASGQLPSIPGNWGLIDLDTPQDAYTYPDFISGKPWQLIFSDEFNVEGRSFYPGDDPYWEAVDLHYWVTNNMEWYDPAAITTRNGSLEIVLERKDTHDLHFQGGMMMTWNKFCFTGGIVLSSIVLPGINNVLGLLPALWAMGNLGRAGYGATLEGVVRTQLLYLTSPNVHHGSRVPLPLNHSGRIAMTRATSAQPPTRRSTVCPLLRRRPGTRSPSMRFLTSLVRGSLAALVPASRIQGPSIPTVPMSAARRRRLISSKHRYVVLP